MSGYSIWVLEYSHVLEYPESGAIYQEHNKGTRRFPYGYVYLRGNGHNIMVDVGFNNAAYGGELGKKFGVIDWQSPKTVLNEVDVRPEDIDIVFATHAHFDHFGNTDAFPNATFYLQERELTKFTWAMALPKEQQFVAIGLDPDDILRGVELAKAGRLKLVDGDLADVLPGINLWAAHDTHTFGCQWVDVQVGDDPDERYVLAGDNVYAYENLQGIDGDGMYRPPGLIVDTARSIQSIAQMVDLVEGEVHRVVPVHEQKLTEVYPSRETEHGLRVTEVYRAEGEKSYV